MFALLLAAFIFSGCSRKLNVEVSIVTKSGQSVKLGLVEVKAVPFSEVAKIVQAAAIDPDVLRATAEAKAKAVRDKNAPMVSSINREVDAAGRLPNQTHEIARLMAKLLELEIAGRPKIIPEKTPKYIFSLLPRSTVSSKTNADGHCVLTLPPGQWAIAARASRELPNATEEYFWIVHATDEERIILSNDNFLEETKTLQRLEIAFFRK